MPILPGSSRPLLEAWIVHCLLPHIGCRPWHSIRYSMAVSQIEYSPRRWPLFLQTSRGRNDSFLAGAVFVLALAGCAHSAPSSNELAPRALPDGLQLSASQIDLPNGGITSAPLLVPRPPRSPPPTAPRRRHRTIAGGRRHRAGRRERAADSTSISPAASGNRKVLQYGCGG